MSKTREIVVALKGMVLKNGRLLIVRRSNYSHAGKGTWECAGGKLEFGEDLEPALEREILEETGLTVTADKIMYASTFNTTADRQVVILTYLCSYVAGDVVLSDEHTDYKWASKQDLLNLLPENILNDFTKNGVFSIFQLN